MVYVILGIGVLAVLVGVMALDSGSDAEFDAWLSANVGPLPDHLKTGRENAKN